MEVAVGHTVLEEVGLHTDLEGVADQIDPAGPHDRIHLAELARTDPVEEPVHGDLGERILEAGQTSRNSSEEAVRNYSGQEEDRSDLAVEDRNFPVAEVVVHNWTDQG